jgi:hypothetical protein
LVGWFGGLVDRCENPAHVFCGWQLAVLFLALSQLAFGFLWSRHATVPDHGFGKRNGGPLVDVLAVNVVAMEQAQPAGVLDAPGPPGGRPLDPLTTTDG